MAVHNAAVPVNSPSDARPLVIDAAANDGSATFGDGALPRRTVASYRTYEQAQWAVDHLADRKFPVDRVAIIAEDIRFVEQVTGRRGYGQAAVSSALSTAVAGALFGFIFGPLTLVTPLVSGLILAGYGFVFGAVVGALLGRLFHAGSGGRRDFTSASSLQADRYDVLVDQAVADEAARILAGMR